MAKRGTFANPIHAKVRYLMWWDIAISSMVGWQGWTLYGFWWGLWYAGFWEFYVGRWVAHWVFDTLVKP